MPDAPPTSSFPSPPLPASRANRIAIGIAIHAGCVFLASFIAPLAMNSIIWPIAGVFWSVLTVPVAVGTGALAGWALKNRSIALAIPVLVGTGIALAAAVGVVIANNR